MINSTNNGSTGQGYRFCYYAELNKMVFKQIKVDRFDIKINWYYCLVFII